jgi:N-acyl-D-aspartate/D-glutamate deacylase
MNVVLITWRFLSTLLPILLVSIFVAAAPGYSQELDVVIANGRVIDPESGLDGVRNIGIRAGRIVSVSTAVLSGRTVIDADGLVVAPGFIDLHVHGLDDENFRLKAMDGVTTALELEAGVGDVDAWYAQRAERSLINYGASSGHIAARTNVFEDPGELLPSADAGRSVASQQQIAAMQEMVRRGLNQGALGVGMGIQYTPGATRWEILEMFRVAAEYSVPVFVHMRAFGTQEPGSSVESVLEVVGASAITGAPVHIVHINSMSLESTPQTLAIVDEARSRGIDVTTEAYPYSAGMTTIESALLDQFEGASEDVYARMQWVATGERLTSASFARYRRQGGPVILHLNTPEMEALAITHPHAAIASDGSISQGAGHPRQAGTFSRVLSWYVRETGQMTLAEALRKMTLLPARRLESFAPMFVNKGRIREGADADIVVFDADEVRDRSTYEDPATPSEGFRWVIVNGTPIVEAGVLQSDRYPGQPARAPPRHRQ